MTSPVQESKAGFLEEVASKPTQRMSGHYLESRGDFK